MSLVFNLKDLKELLVNFHTLTRIRIVVFDDSFHEILGYPVHHTSFCDLIRKNAQLNHRCAACDKAACLYSRKDQRLYTYKCHMGFTETVVPIKADNIVIGYFIFGQVLQRDGQLLWHAIEADLQDYDVDIDEARKSFFRQRIIPDDVIQAAAKILETSVGYLYLARKLTLKKDTLCSRVDDYINTHLDTDLSVPLLCEHFSISKSRLYKLSETNYGSGIARHIRNVRILSAKRLLGDTDLPVYAVAEKTGIPDYNYFTKVFKKATGRLPTEYRRERLRTAGKP